MQRGALHRSCVRVLAALIRAALAHAARRAPRAALIRGCRGMLSERGIGGGPGDLQDPGGLGDGGTLAGHPLQLAQLGDREKPWELPVSVWTDRPVSPVRMQAVRSQRGHTHSARNTRHAAQPPPNFI
jgi:hypothetical protein